jgi:hypothetical protein
MFVVEIVVEEVGEGHILDRRLDDFRLRKVSVRTHPMASICGLLSMPTARPSGPKT